MSPLIYRHLQHPLRLPSNSESKSTPSEGFDNLPLTLKIKTDRTVLDSDPSVERTSATSTVTVISQALHYQAYPAGDIFVSDLFIVAPPTPPGNRALLHGCVLVQSFLRLNDRIIQWDSVGVPAASPGSDLNILDQLGKKLPPLAASIAAFLFSSVSAGNV